MPRGPGVLHAAPAQRGSARFTPVRVGVARPIWKASIGHYSDGVRRDDYKDLYGSQEIRGRLIHFEIVRRDCAGEEGRWNVAAGKGRPGGGEAFREIRLINLYEPIPGRRLNRA